MELNIQRDDWIIEKLGDFAISQKGKKPKNQSAIQTDIYKYPYVDIQAFEKKIFDSYTDGEKCNFCTEDDFLMVWDGSRSGLVGKAVDGAIGSTLVKINLPLIEDYFAYYFLKSKYLEINTNAKGTGTPHVNPDLLWNYNFPIVPILEQKAIVSRIEQLFSELDNGIQNLKIAQNKLRIYRQAVLKKAFEGELTKEWREKQTNLPTADELLEDIKKEREEHYLNQVEKWKLAIHEWEKSDKNTKKPSRISKPKNLPNLNYDDIKNYGTLPKNWQWTRFSNVTYKIGDIDHKMPKDFAGGLPYLSTGNIKKDGSIDFENAKTISQEDFNRLSLKIKPENGDIIFPRYGTIGRNILINFDKEFLVSYSCAIIKNITTLMNNKFVYYYSLSPVIKKEIKRYVVQTTQANIGIASIESFVFPLCSTSEQNQIVQEIESRLSVCDNIETTLSEALKKSEALRQSILKKAFEGKLLTEKELEDIKNNPEYESAEKLLERIKQEREIK